MFEFNLPIFPVLVGKREKSQKLFDLSVFKWKLYHSNPWCSTLGSMNFRKWAFFLLSRYRFTNMELLVSNRSNMKDNPGSTEYQDEFSVHGLKKQETSMESATACSDFTNPA